MRQLRKTALSRETLLVLNAFIFLVLIILNITACGNNDEGKTQNEHHYSPTQKQEYTHQQGGSPTQSWGNKTTTHSDSSCKKNVIIVRIDQDSIYVDGLEYTQPEEAAEYLLSLKIKTQKLIQLNLKCSKAKTSEQFQQMAKAKGIFFNKIITE